MGQTNRKAAHRLLRRLAALSRRVRDLFPLTASGFLLLAVAAATLWFVGVGMLDLILLTAATLVILLTLLLGVATPLAALLVHHRVREAAGSPAELQCGTWAPTGFSARAPRWLPFLSLRAAWVDPPGVESELQGGKGVERVRPARRGKPRTVNRRFTLEDVLGLTAVSWTEGVRGSLRILPARAPMNRPAAIQGMVSGEDLPDPYGRPLGDRVDMRKYGHGDSPRMILWKTYARSRKLFVRIPERAVETAPKVCAYLAVSPHDEPSASLARTVLERDLLGPEWRFGADGAEDAGDLPSALEALALSGSRPEGAPSGFRDFLARAARDGYGACLLFLPYREGGWMDAVCAALPDSPLRIRAVVAVPGWRREGPAPLWRRLLAKSAPSMGASAAEVQRIVRGLAVPNLQFALADVVSGDILADPEGYLARLAAASEAA
ncbi:MAG: DUF58 domain-containing protein [Acidobacteriota bacterium]|jgi:hypothetical protein